MAHFGPYYGENFRTKRVYYTGSDAIYPGYALCYDRDDITSTSRDGNATTYTAAYENYGRVVNVEKPRAATTTAHGNVNDFAGIVAEDGGITGPGWTNIILPFPGTVCAPYIDISAEEGFTAATASYLTVQGGSYYLGAIGEGPVVARAIQDVDRSSTAGRCQAILSVPSYFGLLPQGNYGHLIPTSTVNQQSNTIWDTCPWEFLLANPWAGQAFFEDFVGGAYIGAGGTGGIVTEVNTAGVIQGSGIRTGGMKMTFSGSAASDDGMNLQFIPDCWLPAANYKIWFESRIKITTSGTLNPNVYVGLADTVTAILSSGAIDDTVDKCGFYRDAGDTALKLAFINSTTSTQKETAAAATFVDATWINLGFIIDGVTSLTPYVNGTAGTAHTDHPPTLGMHITLSIKGETTDDTSALDIDWIKVAQCATA